MQLVKVVYCKLSTNSKQLPAFPLVRPGAKSDLRGVRRECYVITEQDQIIDDTILHLCHTMIYMST